MHIEGSYDFEFERELVWDVLMDIDVLGSIIPGSKGLQEIGENKYQSKLAVRVGPVNGKFEANFELADMIAPESYRLLVAGKGPAGHVTGEGTIRLEQADGGTVMHYARRRPHRRQDRGGWAASARCGGQTDRQAVAEEAVKTSRGAAGRGLVDPYP